MALYILKFGGTSVANLARLEHAAQVIRQEILNGNQVVAVVSEKIHFFVNEKQHSCSMEVHVIFADFCLFVLKLGLQIE